MNYSVHWSEEAESRLANAWLMASDRRKVTEAAGRVDARLQQDAHEVGESREGSRRIVHERPLGVVFTVDQNSRMVLVLDLWVY
jgi:hypothetical protein